VRGIRRFASKKLQQSVLERHLGGSPALGIEPALEILRSHFVLHLGFLDHHCSDWADDCRSPKSRPSSTITLPRRNGGNPLGLLELSSEGCRFELVCPNALARNYLLEPSYPLPK